MLSSSFIANLCSSILLRSVACSVSTHNPLLITISHELIGHEFSPFVILDCFDSVLELVLSKCLKTLESSKGVTLLFYNNHDFELGTIIHKYGIVPAS